MMDISVVICTYNRADWLALALRSLSRSRVPAECKVEILVVDNGSTDHTPAVVSGFSETPAFVSVRRMFEPRLGKSYALNMAIDEAEGQVLAFVDDDHLVSEGYLSAVYRAVYQNPQYSCFCGRILPNWDGSEPAWVHHTGPYRIRPFPVPTFNLGDSPRELSPGTFLPGSGNLFLRRPVFDRVGRFSVRLGPRGHNLHGGEDVDFLVRALRAGERLLYVPDAVQYHQVDPARLTLPYLMKKAYHRSLVLRQVNGVPSDQRLTAAPLYLYRQTVAHVSQAVFTMNPDKRRHFLVRLAATVGEIQGVRRQLALEPKLPSPEGPAPPNPAPVPATFTVKVGKTARHHAVRSLQAWRDLWWPIARPEFSRPVFIVGCSRAGTTAVYNALGIAPGLASLHKETHHFWNSLHSPAENNWDSHILGRPQATEADRQAVSRFFYRHLGARRFVDKANQNCFRIPYLLALFPDACFVYLKRDGRDNVNSLIHGWARPDAFGDWAAGLPAEVRVNHGRYRRWCFFLFPGWRAFVETSIEEVCAEQWVAANQAVLAARREIPPAQWVEIRYEDMLRGPAELFREVYERLDLRFTARVREYCQTLLARPYNALSPPRLEKWKDENRERIARIVPRIAPMMAALGYEV